MTLDERIGRYIAECPPAVSGQDGHGTTFRVAVALVWGFALDPEAALRWMLVWNAGCMPPWKPRELRHKVEQAGKVAHEKPRGHLLGVNGNSRSPAAEMARKSVPVPLTPRKSRFRTLGTVFSEPCVNAREGMENGNDIYGAPKQTSQASRAATTIVVESLEVFGTRAEKGVISNDSQTGGKLTPEDWTALRAIDPSVQVPGCKIARPSEIAVADEDWHALEAVGLADDPLIQLALVTFGPGCTVIQATSAIADKSGRAKPCAS